MYVQCGHLISPHSKCFCFLRRWPSWVSSVYLLVTRIVELSVRWAKIIPAVSPGLHTVSTPGLPRPRCLITTLQCVSSVSSVSTQEALVSNCAAAVNICKAPGVPALATVSQHQGKMGSVHLQAPWSWSPSQVSVSCSGRVSCADPRCLAPTCGRSPLPSPGLAAWSSLSAGRRVKYYRISLE